MQSISDQIDSYFAESSRHYYAGSPTDGLIAAERGVKLARELGSSHLLRKCLTGRGILESDLHLVTRAYQSFSEALDLAVAADDTQGICSVWINVASMLFYAGLPRPGIEASNRAIDYAHKVGDANQRNARAASAMANIAYGCIDSGQYALGLRSADASIDLFQRCASNEPGLRSSLLFAILYKTRLFLRSNAIPEARECSAHIEELMARRDLTPRVHAFAEATLALAQVHFGNHESGFSRLSDLLRRQRRGGPTQLAGTYRDLVDAHNAAHQHDVAATYMRRLADHLAEVRSAGISSWTREPNRWLSDVAGNVGAPSPDSERRSTRLRKETDSQTALLELSAAAELYEDSSGMHPLRVGRLAAGLATHIGLDSSIAAQIGQAAALHDVGKIGVPPSILRKSNSLTDAEWEIVRTHCARGADLLASNQLPHGQLAAAVARSHHEWWSGQGYPDRLRETRIPLEARITAIADSFDALTHDRPYRPKMQADAALELMLDLAGRQFDPELVESFRLYVGGIRTSNSDLDAYLERDSGVTPFLQAQARLQSQIYRLGPFGTSPERRSA